MSNNPRTSQLELPKSILGRIAFGVVCVFLLVFSAAFLYAYIYGILSGRKLCDTVEGFVFHYLAGAILESLFLFSLLGLVWAVVAPGWVDRLFQWAASKLMLLLALLGLLGLPFAVWALCKV